MSFAARLRKAVPCPHSCHRASAELPYNAPYTAKAGSAHHVPRLR